MERGRPTELTQAVIEQAPKLYELGLTDAEVADFFEVSVRTIHRWKLVSEAFCHSTKLGKMAADERVEKSLYHRALGYEHDEVDIKVIGGEIVKTPIRKFYPPDTTAAIFWLKNRKSQEWRDIKAVELSGKDGGAIETNSTVTMTAEEAYKRMIGG